MLKQRKKTLKTQIDRIYKTRGKNLRKTDQELYEKIKHLSWYKIKRLGREIRFQRGMSNRYLDGLIMSKLYLDKIKEIFRGYGLPTELAYLPHVESSFNYRAYSKVGAAGIWQFMRGTAKHYKLELNYVVDERRDPIFAAKAAARLLRDNYKSLKSWPLALTAYNHGPSSIRRAVRRVKTTDIETIIQKYQTRSFGFASKNFYATFMAAAEISEQPDTYFKNIKYPKPVETVTFQLPKRITLNDLLEVVEMDKESFKKLNKSLRPVVYRTDILIPRKTKINIPPVTDKIIASYKTTIRNKKISDQAVTGNKYHIVKKGENLHRIGRKYRTSVKNILEINRLYNPSLIRPGMKLLLPGDQVAQNSVKKKYSKRN